MTDNTPNPQDTPQEPATLEGYEALRLKTMKDLLQAGQVGAGQTEDELGNHLFEMMGAAEKAKEQLGTYFDALSSDDQRTLAQKAHDQRITKVDFFPDLYDKPAGSSTP